MWRETIETFCSRCKFYDPATNEQIAALETALGVQLPDDLMSLLLETNGVLGEYDEAYDSGLGVVYSTEGIAEINLMMRQHEGLRKVFMPFDHLLFIGDDGAGDQYGFPISATNAVQSEIFLWDHESDDRSPIAYSLEEYLRYNLRQS